MNIDELISILKKEKLKNGGQTPVLIRWINPISSLEVVGTKKVRLDKRCTKRHSYI